MYVDTYKKIVRYPEAEKICATEKIQLAEFEQVRFRCGLPVTWSPRSIRFRAHRGAAFPTEYSEREGQGVSSRELSSFCSLLVYIGCSGSLTCRLKTCRREIQRNTQGFPFRSALLHLHSSAIYVQVCKMSVSFVPLVTGLTGLRDTTIPRLNWPWISFATHEHLRYPASVT